MQELTHYQMVEADKNAVNILLNFIEHNKKEVAVDYVWGESSPKIARLAKMLEISPQRILGWIRRGRISRKGVQMITSHPTLGAHFNKNELRNDGY